MSPVTFRNSKITYYGPHDCENCGVMIVNMGREWGGTAFTNPEGPIYPNTEWHPHVCDQDLVRERKGFSARQQVTNYWRSAVAVERGKNMWIILGQGRDLTCAGEDGPCHMIISAHMTYASDENGAWVSALERQENGWPVWYLTEEQLKSKF